MSYIRLNISDQTQTLNGEVHGGVGDALVAALSAEPETIDELALALARFVHPQNDESPFHQLAEGQRLEPFDAGILIIDLAARIVAVESTYSQPSPCGQIAYHDGTQLTDIPLLYRLPDDWLFVYSVFEYEAVAQRKREERKLIKPIDARPTLYGLPLSQFIASESLAAMGEISTDLSPHQAYKNREAIVTNEEMDAFEQIISAIHKKWWMTPRDDLEGHSPRETMLARKDFIDADLHSREIQWSFTGRCPPPLALDSIAYTCAAFGTHEIVVYYDLVRHLLDRCFERLQTEEDLSADAMVEFLEREKAAWLSTPNRDYSGVVPSRYIELERRRIPFVVSAQEAIIDEDYYECEMMAEKFGTPMFRHLDGAHMGDCFEFSFYATSEEWEAEEERRREFNREFSASGQERQEKGLSDEPFTRADTDEDLIH
jgi:hypothetical protein